MTICMSLSSLWGVRLSVGVSAVMTFVNRLMPLSCVRLSVGVSAVMT